MTQPGVLNAQVNCLSGSFSIDYDSRIISDERIAHVAHRFAPQLLTQSQNCSGRLNQASCESCILHLEKLPLIAPGVRRATASFSDRILELSYSGTTTAPAMASNGPSAVGAILASPAVAIQAEPTAQENRKTEAREQQQGTLSRTKAIFVAATLLLMISALLLEQFLGRGFTSAALFVGAYFFGGYFV